MQNVIGSNAGFAVTDPNLHIATHVYGKDERPGRKLGHVTIMGSAYPEKELTE